MPKANAAKFALPAKYRRVQTGNFPETHDFKKQPVLEGLVVDIKTVQVRRGKKLKAERIMTVSDSDGVLHGVWESANLKGLMDEAKVKDEIYIKAVGTKLIKKGQNPMKLFETGIAPKSK